MIIFILLHRLSLLEDINLPTIDQNFFPVVLYQYKKGFIKESPYIYLNYAQNIINIIAHNKRSVAYLLILYFHLKRMNKF
jgi:hypothetical protein